VTDSRPLIQRLRDYRPRVYSDGDSEERLLTLFEHQCETELEAVIEELLAGSPSWPERVHLSPQRRHLLDWYPFDVDARLLEIGAGCGALTGLLCDRVAHVDALDLSARRAEIISRRHRTHTNLEILVGDLASLLQHRGGYDYAVAVGVLEYAGRYVDPPSDYPTPYLRLLQDVHNALSPGGTLLLAIENQLGSRYLSGAAEDHYSRPLVGVEDYIEDGGVRTFGQRELRRLLEAAGFTVVRHYYPVPDYKFPTAVYSDELLPGRLEHIGLVYSQPAAVSSHLNLFDEARLMQVAARNALVGDLANSLLLECRR
jgi:cyclopropane fatty-acyl-phospholipid synthase-like methyltransferase